MSQQQADALTDDQAAVYDRQLRVWGVETQRKLTAARVLLLGFGKLAAEVAKNITLAGVGHVTLLDSTSAIQHVGVNFLIPASATVEQTCAQAAAATLQAMNPFVRVTAAAGGTDDEAAVAAAISQHDLVIATGLPLVPTQRLDGQCRAAGVGFMAAAAAGPGGWFFLDLQEHSYMPKGCSGSDLERQLLHYSSLADALASPSPPLSHNTHAMYYVLRVLAGLEAKLQRQLTADDIPAAQQKLETLASSSSTQFATAQQLLGAMLSGAGEFAPVCAVLGGVIANNVVTAVSANGAPLNNFLYYTLFDGRAIAETIQPVVAEPAAGVKAAAQQQQQQQQEDTIELD